MLFESWAVTSALYSINSRIVSGHPRSDALCNGVEWVSFFAFASVPFSSNIRTMSGIPEKDARCKGVEWVKSSAVTSAPWPINSRKVSAIFLGLSASSKSASVYCPVISAHDLDQERRSSGLAE
jgi:hypothetical protein